MVTNRQKHIDEVSGLLILVVIIMHCFHNADLIHTKAYSITYPFYFSMPWFFFKSGMYYHHRENKLALRNGFFQLIVPFLFFSSIGVIIHTLRTLIQGCADWGEYLYLQIHQFLWDVSFKGNDPLWFLFVLFMVKLLFNGLEKFNVLWISLICFLVFNALYYLHLDCPYFLASIPAGFIFYTLGYTFKHRQYNKIVASLSAIVYILCALFGWVIVDMHWNICNIGNYILWVPTSLAGIVLFNYLFKLFPFTIGLLEWIGKHAIILYVTHWLIIETALLVTKDILSISNLKLIFAILITAEIVSLPIITTILSRKRLSWVIGAKS